MRYSLPRYKKKYGQIPGTLSYTGNKEKPLQIDVFRYDENDCEEVRYHTVAEYLKDAQTSKLQWVNITGLNNTEAIGQLGQHFELNPIVMEDILNVGQRSRFEDYESFVFLTIKMCYLDSQKEVQFEQLSLIMTKHYVLSFQEIEGDVFEPIRDRLRGGKGRVRSSGADYLLFALTDYLIDHYFVVLDQIGDRIEGLEDEVIQGSVDSENSIRIQKQKQDILRIRRNVVPIREAILAMIKSESAFILKKNLKYYHSLYDHVVHITEYVEFYRDLVSGLMDVHMSYLSNRMNEIMKVLTIIATIFIPLTFLAGIYGMNFSFMPELEYRYSYFILLGIMGVIFVLMFVYFRRKKWI